MDTQSKFQADKDGNLVQFTPQPVNVVALVGELHNIRNREVEIISILTVANAIPDLNTEIVSKIQEVPEFAPAVIDTPIDAKPIDPAPLLPPNKLAINQP